jgi:hypothetical protein
VRSKVRRRSSTGAEGARRRMSFVLWDLLKLTAAAFSSMI